MPKQLQLSALIDLPTDVFEAAKITDQVAKPWLAMLAVLKEAGVTHAHTSETVETRAKSGSNGAAPRRRRTKAEMQAEAQAATIGGASRESLV